MAKIVVKVFKQHIWKICVGITKICWK